MAALPAKQVFRPAVHSDRPQERVDLALPAPSLGHLRQRVLERVRVPEVFHAPREVVLVAAAGIDDEHLDFAVGMVVDETREQFGDAFLAFHGVFLFDDDWRLNPDWHLGNFGFGRSG